MTKKGIDFSDEIEMLKGDDELAQAAKRINANRKKDADNIAAVDLHVIEKKENSAEPETRRKAEPEKRRAPQPRQTKKTSWSAPTALLNTRIPPEMVSLIDDLLYQQKKAGNPLTKQELAREAFEDVLKKHKLI